MTSQPEHVVHPSTPVETSTEEVDGLRRKLASLPAIEQAKGMLMVLYGVDADTAFRVLQRWSSSSEVKLRVLAQELVEAAGRPRDQPVEAVRAFLADRGLDATTQD